MQRFDNKIALITGSASGLGRQAALRFASLGATVAGADILGGENAQTAAMVEAQGGRMYTGDSIDLTDEASVAEWTEKAVSQLGGIDVLYANAGATKFSPVAQTSIDEWQWVMKNELDLVFLPIKHAWNHLAKTQGNIVLVGSTAGVSGSMTNNRAAHSAARGGIIALGKQLAGEGAVQGIRVNTVSPGVIRTPATENDLLAPDHPMRNIAKAIPLGRLGDPDDVINCVIFLASEQARYVTGVNLMVDGGWSAVLPGYGVI